MDIITPEKRSKLMSLVRSKDTKPEMIVRKLIFSMGYRYRLHYRKLPGKPDLVFPGRSKVIFVHGCFWHQHKGCNGGRKPKSRLDYWIPKLQKNVKKDKRNIRELDRMAWSSLIIWECELKDIGNLKKRIIEFLD